MKITIIIYPSDLIKGRNDNNVYDNLIYSLIQEE
jgi:hypothetical protein